MSDAIESVEAFRFQSHRAPAFAQGVLLASEKGVEQTEICVALGDIRRSAHDVLESNLPPFARRFSTRAPTPAACARPGHAPLGDGAPGSCLSAAYALVGGMLRVAVGISYRALAQMLPEAAAAGTHVAGGGLDFGAQIVVSIGNQSILRRRQMARHQGFSMCS